MSESTRGLAESMATDEADLMSVRNAPAGPPSVSFADSISTSADILRFDEATYAEVFSDESKRSGFEILRDVGNETLDESVSDESVGFEVLNELNQAADANFDGPTDP